MTLLGTILKKVQSTESIHSNRNLSPPPELEKIVAKKKRKPFNKYSNVPSKVDSYPPHYLPGRLTTQLPVYNAGCKRLLRDNIELLTTIRRMDFIRGLVDCRWKTLPEMDMKYFSERQSFLDQMHRENKMIYKRIIETGPKVDTAESHARDWARNRRDIVSKAQGKFVLFPPVPCEHMEDTAFLPAQGVKRPRVYIELQIQNCAKLGTLQVELFSDVCPQTCQLFLKLLEGDGVGFGYVGTRFYRKIPGLFWSGGDVVYNNGFGCYAQRGHSAPIRAENYHFSHSMPGLLSMHMTCDDEMCGVFNITFKPLTQFDLRNVVFGRVVRPSATFEAMKSLGSALSNHPVVQISGTRYKRGRKWLRGDPNTRLLPTTLRRFIKR